MMSSVRCFVIKGRSFMIKHTRLVLPYRNHGFILKEKLLTNDVVRIDSAFSHHITQLRPSHSAAIPRSFL